MTAGELTEWMAYERTYGSLLIHERIDAGFALVAFVIAKAFSDGKRDMSPEDFMPPWYQELNRERKLERGLAWLKAQAEG